MQAVQQQPLQPQTTRSGSVPLSSAGSREALPAGVALQPQVLSPQQQSQTQVLTQPSSVAPTAAKTADTTRSMEARKRTESIHKEREIIKARDEDTKMSGRLGDLLVPFMSLGVLILIIVFVFIPFGTEVVETREQTKTVVHDVRRNEAKIDILRGIDADLLEEQLETVSIVVRDQMEVAEMAIEIEDMALGHNLEPVSQDISNTQDLVGGASEVDVEWVPLYADAISGPYSFAGTFDDIASFLKDLRSQSRTILSMGKLAMSRSSDENGAYSENWRISLLISGYTAEPVKTAAITDPVVTTVDSDAMTQIYKRAGKKVETDDMLEEGNAAAEDEGGTENDVP